MFETILYEKDGPLAIISLNRPRQLNAFNVQMRDDLWEILTAIEQDPDVELVLVKAQGERAFCAGADLTEFGSAPSRVIAREARWSRDVWESLMGLHQLVIAAVHGFVIGSGVELALCCDLRIAADNAIFSMPEVHLGMIPAAVGSQNLPRVIGRSRALDMLLTNPQINAEQARDIGLVSRVVQQDQLLEVAQTLCDEILTLPYHLRYQIKRLLSNTRDTSLHVGLEWEQRVAWETFLEKRTQAPKKQTH